MLPFKAKGFHKELVSKPLHKIGWALVKLSKQKINKYESSGPVSLSYFSNGMGFTAVFIADIVILQLILLV